MWDASVLIYILINFTGLDSFKIYLFFRGGQDVGFYICIYLLLCNYVLWVSGVEAARLAGRVQDVPGGKWPFYTGSGSSQWTTVHHFQVGNFGFGLFGI